MPDNPSLSIIIPVFNVEKYLSMCIDSLLKAEGIEETDIILVDDSLSKHHTIFNQDKGDCSQCII